MYHRPLLLALPLAATLLTAPSGALAQAGPGSRVCFSGAGAHVNELVATPEIEALVALQNDFREEVRRASAEAGVPEPRGYLVLEHDRATGAARHRLHRSNVPARAVEAAHRRMASRIAASDTVPVVSVNIRLDTLPRPVAGDDETVVGCAPELQNVGRLQRALLTLLERHAPRGNPPVSPVLRFLVTRDGEVAFLELVRPTGITRLDRALIRQLPAYLQYAPATDRGVPMDMWVEQPLELPRRNAPPPEVLRAGERRRP